MGRTIRTAAALGLGALLLVVSGCTTSISGSAIAAATAGSGGPGSGSGSAGLLSMAKFATADACSLVPTSVFNGVAPAGDTASAQVTGGGYGDCAYTVVIASKSTKQTIGNWFVYVNLIEPANMAADLTSSFSYYSVNTLTPQQANGITVYQGQTDKVCARAFLLQAGRGIGIAVNQAMTRAPGDECAYADKAVTASVATIKANKVQTLDLPGGSLGLLDFCAKFASVASQVLGGPPSASPAVHGCDWSGNGQFLGLQLAMGSWPYDDSGEMTNGQIAGHNTQSIVSSSNGSSGGSYYLDHGPSPLTQGEDDVLSLFLKVPGDTTAANTAAQRFYTAALALIG